MSDHNPDLPRLPEPISGLREIAMNLSWRWNPRARYLFRRLDRPLWHRTRHNPVAILREVDPARLARLAEDVDFRRLHDEVLADCRQEDSRAGTWMAAEHPDFGDRPVAYFCAEFGLHNSVPIYSGGLGVLAGDHCKTASDLGLPLVGVGLLYVKGYFDQTIRLDGWQEDTEAAFDPASTPLVPVPGRDGDRRVARLEINGHDLAIGAWKLRVGRVPIYLLDTDLEENRPEDRQLASRLYPGGRLERLQQEWILGAGGVRVLRAVGVEPVAWHANEGHAAFMLLERVRERMERGSTWEEAVAHVRASSVFTTHTPVPAGHDIFPLEQVEACAARLLDAPGMSTSRLAEVGRGLEGPAGFHMTALAIRLSGGLNGVSETHGRVTRRMWHALWPDRAVEDVPVGHITNGVHLSTWMSHSLMSLLDGHLGAGWVHRIADPRLWEAIRDLDDEGLWRVHRRRKETLLAFVRERARHRWAEHWGDSGHLVGAGTLLAPDALTIGFARRFAEYKRADLLFRDADRLRRLVTDPHRPVQVVFAGKAHPADDQGKRILQRVYEAARDPGFEGRIAFLEDYELHMAHRLVQGVDLWLNLPRPPLEACGTSGMKAALNAVPQLGTCDGWWAEGYEGSNGWQIPPAPEEEDVDAWDARHLYEILEERVVPLYYEGERHAAPRGWVAVMKEALRIGGSRFTARRMLREYVSDYYLPARRGALSGAPVEAG
jgi:starch phosphorylase